MVKYILCATKVGERWHIREKGVATYCGRLGDYMPTSRPVELPTNVENLCRTCLKIVKNKKE